MNEEIVLEKGKYRIIWNGSTLDFYRNREPWEAANRDFKHVNLILAMFQRILELEEQLHVQ